MVPRQPVTLIQFSDELSAPFIMTTNSIRFESVSFLNVWDHPGIKESVTTALGNEMTLTVWYSGPNCR